MTEEEWGPQFEAIHTMAEQVLCMTPELATAIIEADQDAKGTHDALDHVLSLARELGREGQVIEVAEYMRKQVWETVWDSSWADAWKLSWIVSHAAIAVAMSDQLKKGGKFEVRHFVDLIAPWAVGHGIANHELKGYEL